MLGVAVEVAGVKAALLGGLATVVADALLRLGSRALFGLVGTEPVMSWEPRREGREEEGGGWTEGMASNRQAGRRQGGEREKRGDKKRYIKMGLKSVAIFFVTLGSSSKF